MGGTLRVSNSQRAANTPNPHVSEHTLRPLLAASNQPRKFDQYTEAASAIKPKDSLPRADAGFFQTFPSQAAQNDCSRHNSTLFLFNTLRQDLFFLPSNYPMGPGVPMPSSAPGQRQMYPGYYLANRELVSFPIPQGEVPGRLRGDSICLPHPLSGSKYSEGDLAAYPVPQGGPGSQPQAHNTLRSTNIFSSLIQLPESSRNSVSGPSSSKDMVKEENKNKPSVSPSSSAPANRGYSQDFDTMGRESMGNMLGWSQASRPSVASSKRNPKECENQGFFWDQMGNGMTGSIAGMSNDSINAFVASLQNNGSIDFLNMSNKQRRDSVMKFLNDQGQRAEGLSQLLMGTSLREDIFDEQRKYSFVARGRKSSVSDMNHDSPSSSMSSKTSNRMRDEPRSPRASPGRENAQNYDQNSSMAMRGNPQQYAQRPPLNFYSLQQQDAYGSYPCQESTLHFQAPQMRSNYSQFQQQQQQQQQPASTPPQQQQFLCPTPRGPYSSQGQGSGPTYPSIFKGSQYVSPGAVEQGNYPNTNARATEQTVDSSGKQLVQAQQYAHAEDGRPLLGATKVDQLMLVIQAREKGNVTAINQATDGSILASPNVDHDKNAVLPLTVDLVGGIEKPLRDAGSDDSEHSKKRKRKTQTCPYCFKEFHQTTHLDVHVRSHIGLKPFECTYCGKRFTQGGNLRTHMRLHTGEKPFVCDMCNRNFSRKGNLAAHILTHNKEKPYDCKLDNCDKSFTQLGNLKSHQNKFHLPTLTKLTQTFASIKGDALAQLPEDEKELLGYFAKLYKNANKGIRGRGKGKRVAKIGSGGGELASPLGSSHASPEQLTRAMAEHNNGIRNGNLNGPGAGVGVGHNLPMGYNMGMSKYR